MNLSKQIFCNCCLLNFLEKKLYFSNLNFNPHHLILKFYNREINLQICLNQSNRNFSTTSVCAKITPVQMAYTSFKSTSAKHFSSAAPIVIMHGLLGSKTNWKSLGKVLNQQTGRTVYTVDARNHGESPHTEEFDYYSLAEDVLFFLREHSLTRACLMGHSMGGRAVMTAAFLKPDVVEKLFVLDISPVSVSENISTLPRFVELMQKVRIPPSFELPKARTFVDELLEPIIPEKGIRMFLLANLMKHNGQFFWKVNLDAIGKKFNPHISKFPPAQDGKIFDGETHFIAGAQSNYINPEDFDEIRRLFPLATFTQIEGAGHWLHADKPHDFLKVVVPLMAA